MIMIVVVVAIIAMRGTQNYICECECVYNGRRIAAANT